MMRDRNYIREIAERTAQRFAGRKQTPFSEAETGGRNVGGDDGQWIMDPITGDTWFTIGVDTFDDATRHF